MNVDAIRQIIRLYDETFTAAAYNPDPSLILRLESIQIDIDDHAIHFIRILLKEIDDLASRPQWIPFDPASPPEPLKTYIIHSKQFGIIMEATLIPDAFDDDDNPIEFVWEWESLYLNDVTHYMLALRKPE